MKSAICLTTALMRPTMVRDFFSWENRSKEDLQRQRQSQTYLHYTRANFSSVSAVRRTDFSLDCKTDFERFDAFLCGSPIN